MTTPASEGRDGLQKQLIEYATGDSQKEARLVIRWEGGEQVILVRGEFSVTLDGNLIFYSPADGDPDADRLDLPRSGWHHLD